MCRVSLATITTALGAFFFVCDSVDAQQEKKPFLSPNVIADTNQPPFEFRGEKLDSKNILRADIPIYPEKQELVTGLLYPNMKNGPVYFMVYQCGSTATEVEEWWLKKLNEGKWKLVSKDNSLIKATRSDGAECEVCVRPKEKATENKGNDEKYRYSVSFRAMKKHSALLK